MPRVGGFRTFNTARRSIQGFEAMLWLRKGYGFAGAWTVHEQNRLLGFCFGPSEVNEGLKWASPSPIFNLIRNLGQAGRTSSATQKGAAYPHWPEIPPRASAHH